ncbi:MAG: AAA family ATPase, partial [Deltaproteobacteria bacterium]|nr:AAA family ATPase [Deltaproteobacteria bacterium]
MPAARTTSKARRTNLRVPASSFVGRRDELLAIVDAFEVARLVTLVGPGGMGKTRLAIEHARARLDSLARRGRGGVWIVELAEARSAEDAMAEVARVLEVPLAGRASERERSEEIARAIARLGPVLVVLDDLERIATPAARLLAHWLSLAPSARFLVTSRIALGLPEERTLTVGSLGPSDARTLFLDRAAQVRVMATSESEPGLVERIVDAIDRMPLAIELAASRTRVLSTKELSARLDRPLALLSGGVVRERHASVRGAVLDSLALLDPPARRAFALLASVDDGFALDTAEAVLSPLCTGDVTPLETLEALVRTSLVRVEAGTDPTRYALFATIREVAEGLFDEEPLRHQACIAHAEHHLRLVRAARAGGVAEEARIARDLEHFLRARTTAISLGRAHDAVELTLAVEPVLARRGLSSQRASLVDEALTSIAPSDD